MSFKTISCTNHILSLFGMTLAEECRSVFLAQCMVKNYKSFCHFQGRTNRHCVATINGFQQLSQQQPPRGCPTYRVDNLMGGQWLNEDNMILVIVCITVVASAGFVVWVCNKWEKQEELKKIRMEASDDTGDESNPSPLPNSPSGSYNKHSKDGDDSSLVLNTPPITKKRKTKKKKRVKTKTPKKTKKKKIPKS